MTRHLPTRVTLARDINITIPSCGNLSGSFHRWCVGGFDTDTTSLISRRGLDGTAVLLGQVAGGPNGKGYQRIRPTVGNSKYSILVHRITFALIYGRRPVDELDH
jgi:hypothetical protein